MRYALLVVGMLLTWLAPSLASVTYHMHDASYKMVVTNEMPGIRVDWMKQTVFIVTQARAPVFAVGRRAYLTAFDAALAMARQEVCSGLGGLKLTSYATMKDATITHVLTEEHVAEAGKAVCPVADRWDDGQHTITLISALPMTGAGSLGELAARMLKVEQLTYASNALPPVRPREKMTLRPRTPATQISAGPYTGLIVDCTGLHYTPAVLPKFIAEDGKEFWGTIKVSPLMVMEQGVAGYAMHFKDALRCDRIGDTPLIVRPVGIVGMLRGDLVFSAEDAKLIMEQDALSHFLDTLKVVIVLDY